MTSTKSERFLTSNDVLVFENDRVVFGAFLF